MSTEEDRVVAFAAGVVLGGLIGAGTALLLAPRSGRRTRRRLRHAAEDLGDRAEETLEHAAEDARRYADEAKRAAERSGRKMKDSVEEGRKKLRL